MEYGCIGEVLRHSFSVRIHNELFGYQYELKEIGPQNLGNFMEEKDFKAINVTIPYKEQVIPYLDYMDEISTKIGAVNTVVNKNRKLYGYNTDFYGLTALIKKLGIEIKGKKVLVLGSGGTSKTASVVAENLGALEILKVSRSKKEGHITYDEAYALHNDANIIINTTPCGMFPNIDGCAIDISEFDNLEGVIDAVYNPLKTQLVIDAQKRGIKADGGLYMLVAQAVYAAEKFVEKTVPKEEIGRIYTKLLREKENIVLIGMPSSGKTTVGKIIAEKTGKEFFDIDEEIVRLFGRSIPRIFDEMGEAGFREIENRVTESISTRQNAVIATGGGVVLKDENIENLKKNGRIYFLDRPLESLVTTPDRPLSSNRIDLERRYRERYKKYKECCDFCLAGDESPKTFAEEIIKEFML